jgi:pimeloyl-ACP methyl ester carboxylesterase
MCEEAIRTRTEAAPLLLLPGLMCDERIWAPQLAAFPGAISAAYGDAGSLAEMARRALAMAPERFSLVGHSMGGRVALEVWRQARERVARIAIFSTGVHGLRPGEADKRHALLDIGRTQGFEALIEAWLPPMIGPDQRSNAPLVETMWQMCRDAGFDGCERQINALLDRPEVESLLPTITCPALVGVGVDDAWAPPSQHEPIAAAIPRATLEIFEHCGHMAPVEAPEAINAALRRWLARAPAHA